MVLPVRPSHAALWALSLLVASDSMLRKVRAMSAANITEAEIQAHLNSLPWQERRALKDCYAKGCERPNGYADAQDWANAQMLHGLRQTQCPTCQLWQFPHEPRACKGLRCKP